MILLRLLRVDGENKYKQCNTVLSLVSHILPHISINASIDYKQIEHDIKNRMEEITPSRYAYREFLNAGTYIISRFLTHNSNIEWPHFELTGEILGWPNGEAPWLWEWIHVVAFELDLDGGMMESVSFIHFIKRLIGCSICESHYTNKLPQLINALSSTSLSNVFFILHSIIPNNNAFEVTEKNISVIHRNDFFNKYIDMKRSGQSNL